MTWNDIGQFAVLLILVSAFIGAGVWWLER
jgi:uncharacterized membrane protein